MDEFTVDVGQNRSHIPFDDVDRQRKQKLWPTYFSGGMIEFILEGLIKVDSFKSGNKDQLWQQVWYARRFVEQELPFWEMEPADDLLTGEGTITVGLGRGKTFQLGAQVFAKSGGVYAVYLPTAQPAGILDLSGSQGAFELRWYNPRIGEFAGETKDIEAGAPIVLGNPPSDPGEDWVVLVKRR